MRFRKLRIAWSVGWVLACVPLLVLWALSYSEMNAWTMPLGSKRGMIVAITTGRLAIGIPDSPLSWRSMRGDVGDGYSIPNLPTSNWVVDAHQLIVPMWFLVVLAASLSVVPWIPWSTRFSIRAILILTTLVAVVLGLIVWLR